MMRFLAALIVVLVGCSDASKDGGPGGSSQARCAKTSALSWDTGVKTIFEAKCGGCHPGQMSSNYKTYDGVVGNIQDELERINGNSMPPGGMAQADKDAITAWYRAGMPRSVCP